VSDMSDLRKALLALARARFDAETIGAQIFPSGTRVLVRLSSVQLAMSTPGTVVGSCIRHGSLYVRVRLDVAQGRRAVRDINYQDVRVTRKEAIR